MKRGRGSIKHSAIEKRRILRRWRGSGLGPYVFGRQVGLAHSTLYRWVEQEQRIERLAERLMCVATLEGMINVLSRYDVKPGLHFMDEEPT